MTPARARCLRVAAASLAAYFLVASLLALASGALASDVGAFDDEPSHYVTAVMIRDWLAGGGRAHPLAFASDYYLHYPKVAIGQWPPLFHATLGVWMLAFGVSQAACLAFMALVGAAVAAAIATVARRDCGFFAASAAGLLFLFASDVQAFGHMVMLEVPLALACTLAVLRFGRFLEAGRARDALGFGLLASAAILTKGDALALAGLPLLALALSGRWELLRRPALWGAAALVAAICGPWYVLTAELSSGTWSFGSRPNVAFTGMAVPYYVRALLGPFGALGLALAVAGLACGVARERGRRAGRESRTPSAAGDERDERGGRWAALAAWPLCLLALHCTIPASLDARYLVPLLPALACGLALAMGELGALGARRGLGRAPALVPALVLVLFGLFVLERPRRDFAGYGTAARLVLADATLAESPLLIASDPKGEGAFVAGVAAREERPGHVVLRATKVLCRSDWLGRDYAPTFASAAEMQAFLAEVPVGLVLLDESTPRARVFEHNDLLREVLESQPEVWRPVATLDVVRAGVRHAGALRLFRQMGHEERLPARIDLDRVLGREVPDF